MKVARQGCGLSASALSQCRLSGSRCVDETRWKRRYTNGTFISNGVRCLLAVRYSCAPQMSIMDYRRKWNPPSRSNLAMLAGCGSCGLDKLTRSRFTKSALCVDELMKFHRLIPHFRALIRSSSGSRRRPHHNALRCETVKKVVLSAGISASRKLRQ